MRKYTLLSFLLFLFLLGFHTFGYAQTKGIIRGRITDITSDEPLAFVNIVITRQTDSGFSRSLQSDTDGYFSFNNLDVSSYSLKLSYIGYQVKSVTSLLVSADKLEVDLKNISMASDNKLLDEVVVEYKKPAVEILDDKLVYNVDQGVFSEGSVASDILKSVPMVSVDIDGKATIAGRRNTRIFIDGKPSDFSANSIGELLSVLPSDALESIEVITDPSSKFDADGDGIINLVMKKGRQVGLSGNVSSNAGILGNYNAGAFLSSGKKEDFSFNASAGYNHGFRQSEASSSRINIFTDTVFYNNQTNSAERISDGMNARFSGTYKRDSSQVLKFSARGNLSKGESASTSDNHYLNDQFIQKKLRKQYNITGNRNVDYVVDVDYTLTGKSKSEYGFGVTYNRNSHENEREYSRYLYYPNGSMISTEPDLQLNDYSNTGSNLQLNADMDRSFDFLQLKFETGIKFNSNNSGNQQLVRQFDSTSGAYDIHPDLTNSFDFKQSIYAGYVSLKFKLKSWSFRAGSRAELTSMTFKQESANDVDFNPYISLFPSLALYRNFNKKYRVGLNYSRRVTRPRYNVLNPIVDDSDPQNIKFGNINLKPSYTGQFELSFTMFGQGWSVSPRISYAASHKIIERIKTVVNNNGDTETTYQNLANNGSLSFNTYANYQLDKTTSVNGGITISRVNYTSSATPSFNRGGTAIKANAGTSYSFNNNTDMELSVNYIKNTAAQGSSNGSVHTQFGFKRNFLKNKMSARVTIIDPFNQRNVNSITRGPNFHQESYSMQKTRNFMAGLSYRFTKISKETKG